jgi:hypothetical protein
LTSVFSEDSNILYQNQTGGKRIFWEKGMSSISLFISLPVMAGILLLVSETLTANPITITWHLPVPMIEIIQRVMVVSNLATFCDC